MFFAIDCSDGLSGEFTCGYSWNDVYEVSQDWHDCLTNHPLSGIDVIYVGF